jgi:AcrR family transcriptional regulator
MVKPGSTSTPRSETPAESPIRKRILDAAFAAFVETGYAETSTREIATLARVSKRELYGLVGNKQAMLVACITERAARIRFSAQVTVPHDRETLARALTGFGTQHLSEVSAPTTISVFRFAIAEAERVPEVARALDSIGRETTRAALREMLVKARSSKLLAGDPAELAEQFIALLWGNLMVSLLLRVAGPPRLNEIKRRARNATAAFLQLHPLPDKAQ